MSFDFDVSAATTAIAAREATVTLPLPGIVNAYGFGLDPVDIDGADLPCVVHLELGPSVTAEEGRLTSGGVYVSNWIIESRVLLIQDVAGQLFAESKNLMASLWLPIFNVFQDDAAIVDLTTASNANSYHCVWAPPSYQRMAWPLSEGFKWYWGFRYRHIFYIEN